MASYYTSTATALGKTAGPLHPLWDGFVDAVLHALVDVADHNEACGLFTFVGGDLLAYFDDFACKRHEFFHGKMLLVRKEGGYREESRWFEDRYAGVTFAIHALYLRPSRTYLATKSHDECETLSLDAVYMRAAHDHESSWSDVQTIACGWIRAHMAARAIQRAWRRYVVRRRAARLIQARWRFVNVWPRHPVCMSRLKHEWGGMRQLSSH